MSQASNKVEWYIRKAEREVAEKTKHRGLIKLLPDIEEAKKHISKAEHNLSALIYFNKGGFSDWGITAAFYCIYHCFLGISRKFGYESRNQECTLALIRSLNEDGKINIDEKFIKELENLNESERQESSIIEKREFYTYGTTISIDKNDEIDKIIKLCKDCLAQAKDIIYKE